MELVFVFLIVIVILSLLGYPIIPAIVFIFQLMKLLSALSILFFLIVGVLAILARPKRARFLGLKENEKHMDRAMYEIDGEEHPNLFPTDWFLKKLLYRKTEVKVRVKQMGRRLLVFDRVTLCVIALGLPAFSILLALLMHT